MEGYLTGWATRRVQCFACVHTAHSVLCMDNSLACDIIASKQISRACLAYAHTHHSVVPYPASMYTHSLPNVVCGFFDPIAGEQSLCILMLTCTHSVCVLFCTSPNPLCSDSVPEHSRKAAQCELPCMCTHRSPYSPLSLMREV